MELAEGEMRSPVRVDIEVFRHLFTALAEEMGAALRRAALSPNIKERCDYSCALFDPRGIPVAMGDHMPVHLGAMPMSVSAALAALGPLGEGDVAVLNDPFEGGSHLPDVTLVAPVMSPGRGKRLAYVASRAHHSDIGGMSPGSMPIATEIYQEGFRIPPVLLVRGGERVPEVWRLLMANVRTPAEREGDFEAQLAALHTGRRRLLEIQGRVGTDALLAAERELLEYADFLLGEGIERVPDGRWEAGDCLEGDGVTEAPIPVKARLTVEGRGVRIDFAGSAPQVEGGINAPAAVTASACRYVLRSVVEDLLGTELPAGGGSMSALRLLLPRRSVVSAEPPAAVAAGNVETSQRVTDVVLKCFAGALPDRIPAFSQGTMNNTAVGGIDPEAHPFSYYETIGGGMGAGPRGPGLSGVHTHMSNTLNTPVEALEHAYPFRVRLYALRRGSGGAGMHAGGDGLRRDLELLTRARVSIWSERRRRGPEGREGGSPGAPGENLLMRGAETRRLPSKVTFTAEPGDVLSVRSPGGGGFGAPAAPEAESQDAGDGGSWASCAADA